MRVGSISPALWRAPAGVVATTSGAAARRGQPPTTLWSLRTTAALLPREARSASVFTSMKESAARAVISHAIDHGIAAERIGDREAQAVGGAGADAAAELYDADDAETWRAIAVRCLAATP
jgi:hypothetical protein